MKLRTIAIRNIMRRKGKVALIVAGLAVAVATFVSIISVASAFRGSVDKQLNEYGFNIAVYPKTDQLSLSYGGMTISGVSSYRAKPLGDSDLTKINSVGGRRIRVVSPKILQVVRVKDRQALLAGIDFASERRIKNWWQIGFGLFPKQPNEVLVGDAAAGKLNIKTGDNLLLSGKEFRVAGILFQTGSQDDNLIFANFDTVRRTFGRGHEVSLVELAAMKSDDVTALTAVLKKKLTGATVSSISQAVKFKENAMSELVKFGLAITGIIVFISALIVFTTMASSVNERRQEIGIFRAIGYRQSKIAWIIFTEVLIVSLAGGIIGYLFGFGLARVIPLFDKTFKVLVAPSALFLLISVAMSIIIAMAASAIPAWRAANLDPIESLKNM